MRDRSEIRQKIKQAQFRHTKRELVARFGKGEWPAEEVTSFKKGKRDFFAHASIPEIAKDYPDVAALLWALGERGVEEGLMAEATLVGRMGGVFLWADTLSLWT